MRLTQMILATALCVVAGCATTAPEQAAAATEPMGRGPAGLRLDNAYFTAVYPFFVEPEAGLAAIRESGWPGMLYYADPG